MAHLRILVIHLSEVFLLNLSHFERVLQTRVLQRLIGVSTKLGVFDSKSLQLLLLHLLKLILAVIQQLRDRHFWDYLAVSSLASLLLAVKPIRLICVANERALQRVTHCLINL